jgi:DNA-binding MarR family transcriptional regulator
MPETDVDVDIEQLADELRVSIGFITRRLRQVQADGDLSLPETTALARLDRGGPTTVTALAKRELVSAQSMGATIAGLESRGLVTRKPDPDDGRQSVIALTKAGLAELLNKRNARTELIARALASELTAAEVRRLAAAVPLIERVAQKI